MARIAQLCGLLLCLQAGAGLVGALGTGWWQGAARLSVVSALSLLADYAVFVNASLLVAGIAVIMAATRSRAGGAAGSAHRDRDPVRSGRGAAGPGHSGGTAAAHGYRGGIGHAMAEERVGMEPEASACGEATIVAARLGERALMWVGLPLLGTVLGSLVKGLADWAVTWPWVPFEGPLQLVATLPDLPTRIGGAAVGLVAGLVLASIGESEALTVTVDDDSATFQREKRRQTFHRSQASAVFKDRKRLVALGPATEELAGQDTDLSTGRLAAAFRKHGYPWVEGGDPHAGEYRRWVEGVPELSASAHGLFAARARALGKDGTESAEDAEALRAELGKLGLVVRDERKTQYWRGVAAGGTERG